MRLPKAVHAPVLLAVLAAACSSSDDSTSGALELESGVGQTTILKPHPPHQPVTFGSTRLCVTGGPVTLTGVAFDSGPRPEKLTTSAWVVDEGDDNVVGLGSFDGTPQQYLAEGNPGTLHPVKNLKVSNSCPSTQGSFVDILVTAQASARGAKFSKVTVHYTEDGESRSVTSGWGYVFCGTATTDEDDCT